MPTDAFKIPPKDPNDPSLFTKSFLMSQDFDDQNLRTICKEQSLPIKGLEDNKLDRAERLAKASVTSIETQQSILRQLVYRNKAWLTFSLLDTYIPFDGANPIELLFEAGEETWYGPLTFQEDKTSVWYIHPFLIRSEWETKPETIRWLCFARLNNQSLSLHWKGFTYTNPHNSYMNVSIQHPYWKKIPDLFNDIVRKTQSITKEVNLSDLVLTRFWNLYRGRINYNWDDTRIRAETGGMTMNARGGVRILTGPNSEEVKIGGLKKLAKKLQEGVTQALQDREGITVPDPQQIEEVFLSIIIKDIGPMSYEFKLAKEETAMDLTKKVHKHLGMHIYFGVKPGSSSADSFPHIRIYNGWGHDLAQLQFLLDHL